MVIRNALKLTTNIMYFADITYKTFIDNKVYTE